MTRRTVLLFLFLAAAAFSAPAQVQTPSNYAPGREQLAEDTFRKLVEMAPLLDKMNLAGDLATGDRIIEGHIHLRTALLENLLFDYCNISDSLKTVENHRVTHFIQRRRFTNHSSLQWNELGRSYALQRAALENLGKKPLPLYLDGNPLSQDAHLPRLRWDKLPAPPRDIIR